MAVAYRIDVELFHQFDVGQHGCFGDGFAELVVMLVPIDAFDQDGLAVDEQFAPFYFNGTEADFVRHGLDGLLVAIT